MTQSMPYAVAKRASFEPPNYHLPIRNLQTADPVCVLSDGFSRTQRLRLSIGKAEEVLRGDQDMETKKRTLAALNRLLNKIDMLSFFNHNTFAPSCDEG